MTLEYTLHILKSFGSKKSVDGMKRFQTVSKKAFDISTPKIRTLAKQIKKTFACSTVVGIRIP
ncbi:MAG: hypothetical protein M0R68_15675 [Bacteroidetes bacterium]|nr:hypothetical protein [Bacteroidota bacterium]